MPLLCEDLARYGVVLVPPSGNEYPSLLAEVERTIKERPIGAPPVDEDALSRIAAQADASAILVNRSSTAIASVAYIWTFRTSSGRIVPHRYSPGTSLSVLLPSCDNPRTRKFDTFWNTIFPGSKRLMTADGHWYGDNTDVRPAAEDELWPGGFICAEGLVSGEGDPVKLTLDGVLFVDGGFAGPNHLGTWERSALAVEAHLTCAKLARAARSLDAFFENLAEFTGYCEGDPPPPPGPPAGPPDLELIRKGERWSIGFAVNSMRQRWGDHGAIARIAAWDVEPRPNLHRL